MSTTRARVYLDWNATAPLRPEAKGAMLAAMDVVGNPSSVHAEGRAARAIVEKARGQVARLAGCEAHEVIFTSGATEAAKLTEDDGFELCSALEHDCIWEPFGNNAVVDVSRDGVVLATERGLPTPQWRQADLVCLTAAQNETGVVQPLGLAREMAGEGRGRPKLLTDAVQAVGRIAFAFRDTGYDYAIVSAHKLGGPKGVGALIARDRRTGRAQSADRLGEGGGQEGGLRAGTENVIGIAGFGAAAEAAGRDLEAGAWERVALLRDRLEERLEAAARDLIVFGRAAPRLPNTSCFAVPGWAGETQVMALDLAGFAVSAGSACSSGKVKRASRALLAMGFDEVTASSAIRVSMGPATTEGEVMAFADAWEGLHARRAARAA